MTDLETITAIVSKLKAQVEALPEPSPVLNIALDCLFIRAQQEASLSELMDIIRDTFLDMADAGSTLEWIKDLSLAIEKEKASTAS